MVAKYNNELFNFVSMDTNNYIMTYDKKKIDDSFTESRDYFIKKIISTDSSLKSLCEVHFIVRYVDEIEGFKEWLVDEGRPLYRNPNIEKDELGLFINHSPKDDTWIQHDKTVSSKIINIDDCFGFMVDTLYIVKDSKRLKSPKMERVYVSKEDFKRLMISYRKENL